MDTIMVICSVYKLMRNGNSYDKESKKMERARIALERSYVEDKNHNWKNNGMWHEIDKEATEEFYELREQRRLDVIEDDQVKGQLNEILTNVVKQGISKSSKKAPSVKVKKEEPKEDLSDLREEYQEVFGKKAFNGWSIEQLKSKINEKK